MASPEPWKPQILRKLAPSSSAALFAQTFSSRKKPILEQPLRAVCGPPGWGRLCEQIVDKKIFFAVKMLWIACLQLVDKAGAAKRKGARRPLFAY
jgi:hypothetical protein